MKFLYFIFIFISISLVSISATTITNNNGGVTITRTKSSSNNFILGGHNLGSLDTGFLQFAQAPSPDSSNGENQTIILAKKRTERPDILRGFKKYHGGWDIMNRHYWSSVGFTGAAGFILAALWLISFGTVLVLHHCFRRKIKIRDIGSISSLRICLMLLIVFTCASAIGCILLSVGQGEFHSKALDTLKYVVNQSDYTVHTLRNVTGYLSAAKSVNVDQFLLPDNVQNEIDKLDIDLDNEADILEEKTSENSSKIKQAFKSVRSVLIVVAAVMLLVSLLGLLLSLLGHRHAINIGWLLVAVTFILCGVFLILNNAVSDTCVAMGEWVDNSEAETALSNILPCVDQRTTNKALTQSREIINTVVKVVNTAIYTDANVYPAPQSPFYHNQSGPMMPILCSPFDPDLSDRQCGSLEVSLDNASSVWQSFMCEVSPSGLCATKGRITPELYNQFMTAVNVSYALYHYAPPLLGLSNCNFVRETFKTITSRYCPPLERYLQMVVAGLGLISVGVMLCLVLWIIYANRPQREEVFVKESLPIKVVENEEEEFAKESLPIKVIGSKDDKNSENKLPPSAGDMV
ncbi:hypothetical protein ACHQM5_009664 [Ranunculus cassubicifolius]